MDDIIIRGFQRCYRCGDFVPTIEYRLNPEKEICDDCFLDKHDEREQQDRDLEDEDEIIRLTDKSDDEV
jgi:hypothetical protein